MFGRISGDFERRNFSSTLDFTSIVGLYSLHNYRRFGKQRHPGIVQRKHLLLLRYLEDFSLILLIRDPKQRNYLVNTATVKLQIKHCIVFIRQFFVRILKLVDGSRF